MRTGTGAPGADLKWGGHGLSEVSRAPKGRQSRGPGAVPWEKLKIKTKMLISGHFSGYSELHRTRISSTRTRELTAM